MNRNLKSYVGANLVFLALFGSFTASAKDCDEKSDPYCLYIHCNGYFSTTVSQSRLDRQSEKTNLNWTYAMIHSEDPMRKAGPAVSVRDGGSLIWVIDPYGATPVSRKDTSKAFEPIEIEIQTHAPGELSSARWIPQRRNPNHPIPMKLSTDDNGNLQLAEDLSSTKPGQTRRSLSTAGGIHKRAKALLASQIAENLKSVADRISKEPWTAKKQGIDSLMDIIKNCKPLVDDLKESAQSESENPTLKEKLESEAKRLRDNIDQSIQNLITARAIFPGGKILPEEDKTPLNSGSAAQP